MHGILRRTTSVLMRTTRQQIGAARYGSKTPPVEDIVSCKPNGKKSNGSKNRIPSSSSSILPNGPKNRPHQHSAAGLREHSKQMTKDLLEMQKKAKEGTLPEKNYGEMIKLSMQLLQNQRNANIMETIHRIAGHNNPAQAAPMQNLGKRKPGDS